MNNPLGVNELLDLLNQLKRLVHQFAVREEKLAADHRAQSSAKTKAFELEDWKLSTRLADNMAKADAEREAGKQHCQAQFEKRTERIRQAHRTSRNLALERVEQWEGRGKYNLQKSMIETERRRETGLANAAASLEEFKLKLGEQRVAFEVLEAAAFKAFRGYRKFRRWLSPEQTWPEFDRPPADESPVLVALDAMRAQVQSDLAALRKLFLPRVFGLLSIWLLLVLLLLSHAALVPFLHYFFGIDSISYQAAALSLGVSLAVLFSVYYGSRHWAGPAALKLATNVAKARHLQEAALAQADAHYAREQERIKNEFETMRHALDQQWQDTVHQAAEWRTQRPIQIDAKERRIVQKNEGLLRARLEQLEQQQAATIAHLRQETEVLKKQLATAHEAQMTRLNADYQVQDQTLQAEWKSSIQPVWETIQTASTRAAELFPEWEQPSWDKWVPPLEFKNAAQFAKLEVDVEEFAETDTANRHLALPCPAAFSVPLLLSYPRQGSILFETDKTGSGEAVQAINTIIFRLLATTPPGKVSFTIIDPVGLGQSFAGLMHLADYAESYVNGRIWTQSQQIEEKLAELNEHMEKVIQMYLRNEYATIAEYNAQAGTLAEKYHFLVIAGFPVNFSETAGRRLLNIAASGARCGVYLLIHWDHRHALPHDFVPDELRKNQVCLTNSERGFALAGQRLPGTRLVLDAPPSSDFVTSFLHAVGQSGKEAARVEVPFTQVAPSASELWTEETEEELRVAIGRSGATKLQYLAVGQGTRQHALIAGKTGSGKSTLFHVIITNLALWCSPEQVEFYLVDFKKGVEFKCYATRRLPHARVVAIESDREFGLSVLQRVDEELRRRGDLFRSLNVQDLPGYKKASGGKPLPRCLLMIDEFQEFFVEEDRISQNAAALLDRIVRQGRAFGIHVLLGSQTLGGAYTLARATLGQMVIRIALQCNEADAYLIMDESNAAPRLLSRPGEGIYNDMAGALEGNSPFQTVWLPDEVRDNFLAKIQARAAQQPHAYPGPMVFEGNAPAEVRENAALRAAWEEEGQPPLDPRIWLGAPNSIKGPTEAVFHRQSGNHLLVVGQREEAALAIVSIALMSLAAQYPPGTVRFILFDSSPPGSRPREYLDFLVQAMPHAITQPKAGDLAQVLGELVEEWKAPVNADHPAEMIRTFLFFHGLENYRKLRQEDDFSFSLSDSEAAANPATLFVNLINEGPSHGLHIIATCDTYNNVTRFLGRKSLSEIAMRVLFQMSAGDSANLIEAPDASVLGLHRALFYHEQEGYLETFRPYALPGKAWLDEIVRSRLHSTAEPT